MSTYWTGNFAPVGEVTATELRVVGELPKELNGRYLRNGPNPIGEIAENHHWFLGDGMVHGICLQEGRAAWYRNRYVGSERTASFLHQQIGGVPDWSGSVFGPNTNVGGFAGTTWAMVEAGGTPVELTYELDSIGRNDFSGTLNGSFTAHPKHDPFTGELHAMTYAPSKWFDHTRYVVVDTGGRVRKALDIPMGMSMVHDMSLTKNYAVIYDFPVTLDISEALSGHPFPYKWTPDYGSRVGLLPREGAAESIIWVDAPICYAFHPLNSYERPDGAVVIDICVYSKLFDHDRRGPFGDSLPTLERWVIDPTRRTTSVTVIDDSPVEFPRHAPKVGTVEHRFGYAGAIASDSYGSTLKYDFATGTRTEYSYGPGRGAGEAVFVARENATAEDDGWLMAFVHAHDASSASFVVLDAQDLARGPVAEVSLPQAIPYGFHGNWVSDRSVPPRAS